MFKKTTALLLALLAVIYIGMLAPSALTGTGVVGDADADGSVTVLDATRIQRYLADIVSASELDRSSADADRDGKITVMDPTRIQRYLAGICNMDGSTPYKESGKTFQKAYYDVLREKYNQSSGKQWFKLIFIDGNNTPELACFTGYAHMDRVQLYTYYNNKAVYLGSFGAYGTISYSERNNRIFGYTGMSNNDALEAEYTYMIRNGAVVKAPDYKGYKKVTASPSDAWELTGVNIWALKEGIL